TERAKNCGAAEVSFAPDDSHVAKAFAFEFLARLFVEAFLRRWQRTERLAKNDGILELTLEFIGLCKFLFKRLAHRSLQLAKGVLRHARICDFHGVTPVFSRFQSRRSVWMAV